MAGKAPASALDALLARMVAAGAVSAAAALIGDARSVRLEAAVGRAAGRRHGRTVPEGAPVSAASRFDLASLTKPFVASLALVLDRRGLLPLDTRIGGLLPTTAGWLGRKHLASLLRHRAGLAAWAPVYLGESKSWKAPPRAEGRGGRRRPSELVAGELAGRLVGQPVGTYSDLGYLLWCEAAERALGRPLETLLARHLAGPLGCSGLAASPGPEPGVVGCALDTRREVELAAGLGLEIPCLPAPGLGVVQDGNARFLGGVPGHAGLFGSARDAWRLAAEWLQPGRLLDRARVVSECGRRGPFVAGWRVRPPAARGLGGRWLGHTGFTGGGAWLRVDRGEVRVLLAHRTAVDVDLTPYRREFLRLEL